MASVDDFLEDLADDFGALYKENAILKSKLKVLVEKVEEYRSTEDAMRMALLTAQKLGDDIVADAKEKSREMIENAEEIVRKKLGEQEQEFKNEEFRLKRAREATQEFVQASRRLMSAHDAFLGRLDQITETEEEPEEAPAEELPAPEPEVPAVEAAPAEEAAPAASRADEVDAAAKEIDEFMSRMLADDDGDDDMEIVPQEEVREEPVKQTKLGRHGGIDWDDEDEPTSPRPKFDFSNLQFGSNYGKDND